jgi:hypothetical protein
MVVLAVEHPAQVTFHDEGRNVQPDAAAANVGRSRASVKIPGRLLLGDAELPSVAE